MCEVENTVCSVDEDGEPPAKRPAASIRVGGTFKWNLQALTTAADAVESGGKSPVSALNELGVRVSYSLLRQGGPAHCPIFTVALNVADMTFEGWGHSKRDARAAAARSCLSALLARAGRVMPANNQTQVMDFTSDHSDKFTVSEFQCLEANLNTTPCVISEETISIPDSPTSVSPSTGLFGGLPAAPSFTKSPINLLYENYPGLSFLCTFGDGSPLNGPQAPLQLSHSMRFKVVCSIKEQNFEGYGSSKKLAKLAAARAALAVLSDGRVESSSTVNDGALPQTLADHVSKLVNEKFNELMKDDLTHSKRKVLAGIVVTIDNKTDGAKVIAVTTGTKCVSGEHMSVRGRAVNDCHAEVAARRCLQRYLYAQLLKYAAQPNPQATIPELDLEPVPGGGGYQLKSNRHLHLYVSTAPCGDGRIFSPHEPSEPAPDRHPNRQARGQLRTKIESGEGTIPVKNCNNVVQTWDGVMQGERLLTMSCSDKVARWCVVGLQGALLSRLIRPVYLHSLVLGSLLHPHHMYRALCGRIEGFISSLPPPFQLHKPILARAASTEARTPARAPSFSVCWSITSPIPEVLNAMTGKLESGQPSLLCKQSMFARWQYLIKRLTPLKEELSMQQRHTRVDENLLYNEAKQLCPAYQEAKTRLFEAFERAKLGKWIKKPQEQDQFACELLEADPRFLFAWAGDGLREYNSMQEVLDIMVRGLGTEREGIDLRPEKRDEGDIVADDEDRAGFREVEDGSGVSHYEDRGDIDDKGLRNNEGENEGKVAYRNPGGNYEVDESGDESDVGIATGQNKGMKGIGKLGIDNGGQKFEDSDYVAVREGGNNRYHYVVKNRVNDGQKFLVENSEFEDISVDDSFESIDKVISRTMSSVNEEYNISDKSDHSIDSNVNLNETDVEIHEQSKYLEMLRRRIVNQNKNDKNMIVSVEFVAKNESSSNVDDQNESAENTDNDKFKGIPVERKGSKNIHRTRDKVMETLQYRYFQEAERFWNPRQAKQNNDFKKFDADFQMNTINVKIDETTLKNNESDLKNDTVKAIDNHINDLANNLKDCNIQKDRKIKETMTYYAHPNANVNLNPGNENSPLLNLKLKQALCLESKKTNTDVINTKTYHKNNQNESDRNDSNTEKTTLDRKNKNYETQNTKLKFDLTKPNTSKIYDTERRNDKGIDKNRASDSKIPQTSEFHKPNFESTNEATIITSTSSNRDNEISDINKENVSSNVKNSKKNVSFVKLDNGKCIRSAVLLRKLELSKNT